MEAMQVLSPASYRATIILTDHCRRSERNGDVRKKQERRCSAAELVPHVRRSAARAGLLRPSIALAESKRVRAMRAISRDIAVFPETAKRSATDSRKDAGHRRSAHWSSSHAHAAITEGRGRTPRMPRAMQPCAAAWRASGGAPSRRPTGNGYHPKISGYCPITALRSRS